MPRVSLLSSGHPDVTEADALDSEQGQLPNTLTKHVVDKLYTYSSSHVQVSCGYPMEGSESKYILEAVIIIVGIGTKIFIYLLTFIYYSMLKM